MNVKHLANRPKSHPTDIIATSSPRTQLSKRRSNRLVLKASIGLSGEDRLKCPFTMPASATNLNKHGAVVQLSRDLVVGSVVLVRNQRGSQLSARIVSQLTATKGMSTYGIEFVDQDETTKSFWGISFPSNGE